MKIEKEKLELAARIFLSEEPKDPATGEIRMDNLPEVRLYKQYTSDKNGNAELNMYLNGDGKGWVVLSTDNNLPAVWAKSDEEITEMGDCPPFDMMMDLYLGDMEIMLEKIENSTGKNDDESVRFMKTVADNQHEWERIFAGQLTQRPSSNITENGTNCGDYLVSLQ